MLESLGCGVIRLPAEPALPDSVFVEDVALAFDEVAVATRPGAESRRDEGHAVLEVLGSVRRILRIEAPGTLDGGDVLRIGKRVFVGISARSNSSRWPPRRRWRRSATRWKGSPPATACT